MKRWIIYLWSHGRSFFELPRHVAFRWREPWRRLLCAFTWWGCAILRQWRSRSRRNVQPWYPAPNLDLPMTIITIDASNHLTREAIGPELPSGEYEIFARERAVRTCIARSEALFQEGCIRIAFFASAEVSMLLDGVPVSSTTSTPLALQEHVLLLRTRSGLTQFRS